MEMTSTARQALERLIVQNLIDGALAAGWRVPFVDDGGDELVKCKTATEAMDAVFSVDDSIIHFVGPKMNKRYCVYIILGNGIDCVSDHSVGEEFERDVMDPSTAFMESLDDGGAAALYAVECAKSAELLAALQKVVNDYRPTAMAGTEWVYPDYVTVAREAIAKATGVVAA